MDQERKIGWGILGGGRIANDFAECLKLLPQAEIAAVASSSEERARNFASRHNIKTYYTDYADLARDSNVEVIYVATTHNFHINHALLCIENGKHVLCEKPITTNANEAFTLINAARKQKTFLMEAMWTRFLPLWVSVKKWLDEGLLGELVLVNADFGFFTKHGDFGRHLNPELAGGALLDVGIYPISLACWIYGKIPDKSQSQAFLTKHGVDGISTYCLDFGDNRAAQLSSAVITHTPKEAVIVGTKGYLKVPEFWKGKEVTIYQNGEDPEVFKFPYEAAGFQFEAMEAMNCILNGKTESNIMPLDETLAIMKLMDSFRKDWGLIYPWETKN